MAEAKGEARLDLLAIGRSSVDLYGEQFGGRLEDMASFAKYIGGSPTNLAIGASRLGLRTGLVTAVGDDAMGRFILETLEREAVDHRFVNVDPDRLTALVLLGVRGEGRFELLFHRENAPDLTLSEADIDPAYVARAGAVALSGTHLSTPTVRSASLKAAHLARAAGAKVILDIDFRPALWGLAPRQSGEARLVLDGEASRILLEAASLCDLVVGDEDEVRSAAGIADLAAALRRLREATDAIVVVKRGERGAIAFEGAIPKPPQPVDAPPAIVSPGFAVEVCNLVGAGDAFLAGFLSGWLRGSDLLAALARGNAAGALVAARLGCAPAMPSRAELDAFLERRPRRPDSDPEIARLHRAAERDRGKPGLAGGELFIFAIDHRFQIEDLARSLSADPSRLATFKSLALRALHEAAAGDARYGILLDGEHGASALQAAADLPYWTGRPIERALVRPLEFDGGADVGVELRRWPARFAVKCLVRLHPEDSGTLVAGEIAELRRLFHACQEAGRELMIEIVTPEGRPREARSAPWAIRTLYSAGVAPDWWKLEPAHERSTWAAIAEAVANGDPSCAGIVVLGLGASPERLAEAFEAAASVDLVKGFAVGRTIFKEPLGLWLQGRIDDEEARRSIAEGLQTTVRSWRAARKAALGQAA